MGNLKPCPFCGSADLTVEMREHRHLNTCGDWYYLRCEDCYAKADYPSRDGLIEKWNRRSTLKPEGEQISGVCNPPHEFAHSGPGVIGSDNCQICGVFYEDHALSTGEQISAAYDRAAEVAKKLLQVDDGYSWEAAEDIFHAITNLKDTHPK